MNQHLNLMSEQAKLRECYRDRLRLWTRIWTATLVILGVAGLLAWWPAHRASQHREHLEAQYEPIRLMKAENLSIDKKIKRLRKQEYFVLQLHDNFPVVSLLGLIGESVHNTQGFVFVEDLSYARDKSHDDVFAAAVQLAGKSTNLDSINRLKHSLQKSIPFATVQTQPNGVTQVNDQTIHSFTVELGF